MWYTTSICVAASPPDLDLASISQSHIPVDRVHCESAIPSMSGIGGMIASSVANRVASRLSELVVEEATLLWRFKDDVDDMEEKMRDLEAVIQDVDGKARQGGKDGEAERRWLNKLKSVAYDVEDVLDELDAAQLIKNHQPKVLTSTSTYWCFE